MILNSFIYIFDYFCYFSQYFRSILAANSFVLSFLEFHMTTQQKSPFEARQNLKHQTATSTCLCARLRLCTFMIYIFGWVAMIAHYLPCSMFGCAYKNVAASFVFCNCLAISYNASISREVFRFVFSDLQSTRPSRSQFHGCPSAGQGAALALFFRVSCLFTILFRLMIFSRLPSSPESALMGLAADNIS